MPRPLCQASWRHDFRVEFPAFVYVYLLLSFGITFVFFRKKNWNGVLATNVAQIIYSNYYIFSGNFTACWVPVDAGVFWAVLWKWFCADSSRPMMADPRRPETENLWQKLISALFLLIGLWEVEIELRCNQVCEWFVVVTGATLIRMEARAMRVRSAYRHRSP